ncbi:hypothetical protein KW797_04935, partial [Candidatus Parcubacteria bacterium]|nr:hypothetical protein [Candidatus Parcubacteria bacterium]
MKLLYATSITLPSYRANRLQVTAMSRAFTKLLGDDFILGVGSCEDDSLKGINAFVMGEGRSYRLAGKYLAYAKRHTITHIYCREENMLLSMMVLNALFFRLSLKFAYEVHHLVHVRGWAQRFLLSRAKMVSITRAMQKELLRLGYRENNVMVAPDAVDPAMFDVPMGKEEARRKLGLPSDKKLVVYTGDLDLPWKGADTLYEASKEFDDTYQFLVIGSKPHHVEHFHAHHARRRNFLLLG